KTEEQIYAYVESAVKELGSDIPTVLQDYPQLTQVFMSPALVNRCFADFPSLKMLKHEEAPGLRKLARVREADKARGRRISILVGNGGIHLRHELQPGIGLALRKETLRRRGIIASGRPRAPGPSLDAADLAELGHLLQRVEGATARLGETRRLAGE